MIWFTSDTHFGHGNIIKYSGRPFSNIEEHNNSLIEEINSLVAENDTLYHLGDFVFCKDGRRALVEIERLRHQIRCSNIRLILGNHDQAIRKHKHHLLNENIFSSILEYDNFKFVRSSWFKSHDLTLCHYAMRVWNKSHHGSIHLYGHSHASLPDDPHSLSIDVGVDTELYGHKRFTPYSINEIDLIMGIKYQNYKPIDHHGAREHEIAII